MEERLESGDRRGEEERELFTTKGTKFTKERRANTGARFRTTISESLELS
jgi:hypothetical protein